MAKKRRNSKALEKWHRCAAEDVGDAIAAAQPERKKMLEVARFVRVPGAQWEGSTGAGFELDDGRFEKYPRYEINKLGRENDRLITDYRLNRITVMFRPKDTVASEELADKLNGKFRADFTESSGGEAVDNCYADGIDGGFGAFRLSADLEDENDPENDQKQVRFHPVYDPVSSVFFDPDSKQYDRSDATWCAELFSMSRAKYERKYPGKMAPSEIGQIDTSRLFDWVQEDLVFLARYYEVKLEDVTVTSYTNPLTNAQEVYDDEEIEDVQDELERDGFVKGKSRTIKRRKVYCGIMSGGEWIEDPVLIAGEWIPVIPFYCRRSFIDSKERVTGHAALAMDVQRVENVLVSLLVDNAMQAGGDNIPIIDIEFLPGPLRQAWEMRNKNRPAMLPMQSQRDAKGNIVAQAQVGGYTPSTPLSAGAAGLLDYTGTAMQQITGASNMENLPSNLATDTVDAIFSRIDGTSALYMDNLRKSLRHAGRVWLSMARQCYGSETPMRIVDEQGNDSLVLLSAAIKDQETGEIHGLNDISRGRYEVEADVGESSQTRRQQLVRNLTALLATTDPASDTYQIILGLILDNTDGEGLQDVKEWNRNKLIAMGVVKPQTQQEEKALAQAQEEAANQPPSSDMVAAQGIAARGQAAILQQQNAATDQETKRMKLWLDTYTAFQEGKLTQAQVLESLAKVDNMNHAQILSLLQLVNQQASQQAQQTAQQTTDQVTGQAGDFAQSQPEPQQPAPQQPAPALPAPAPQAGGAQPAPSPDQGAPLVQQAADDSEDLGSYSTNMAEQIAAAARNG